MNRWFEMAAIGLMALTVPAMAKPPTNHVYGPEPDWNAYRQLAEQAVMAKLYDPDSAKFIWSYGYHKGSGKPVLQPTVFGYLACGQVNARNRMGGYTGYSDFMVIIDYGTVLFLGVDEGPNGGNAASCAEGRTRGLYPPLPKIITSAPAQSEAPVAPAAIVSSSPAGFTLRALPDGAYVSDVAAGSRAYAAGLRSGMVIARVNGIPLIGMGDAMLKVVEAAGADASLVVIGGATLTLGARP